MFRFRSASLFSTRPTVLSANSAAAADSTDRTSRARTTKLDAAISGLAHQRGHLTVSFVSEYRCDFGVGQVYCGRATRRQVTGNGGRRYQEHRHRFIGERVGRPDLRHSLTVLQRNPGPKRIRLHNIDRCLVVRKRE